MLGTFSQVAECPYCQGNRVLLLDLRYNVETCVGKGIVKKKINQLLSNIPAGVEHGTKLRVSNVWKHVQMSWTG